ncbi:carbohydrate ABC transporter permease [Galbitalea soli]|uniref:Carbohydrate ABC transporter permease n=1 Tax=Galbitalea soli TaxID=1268042 RepID=A0A7C9PPN8_9MICO|nr:carbohydrate ABC transporter permease [Galbitalea soli]NEM92410.1 carbohydrate ABC transporter permease [Galbitalea soli]NYJ29444.1 xylobiose transport system permease protein [Galbitalea soli]
MKARPNYAAGVGAVIWLAIIAIPLYVMLQATFETQAGYGKTGALGIPNTFTFENYVNAFSVGFGHYFVNTVIVTVSVVAIVVVLVPPLSYAVVRNQNRATSLVFRLFLLGLAIPAQAVIVPIFYLISLAGLYDNLIGVILPTAAFALPICTLILSGSMRDITPELYEAMAVDGASPARAFFRLAIPLSKGGLSTIIVFSALQAWNGFLFPLILTQSDSNRVITLGLFNFQTQYGVNIPGLLAAVVMSMVPVLLVYLFARRSLVQGLMGVGGK